MADPLEDRLRRALAAGPAALRARAPGDGDGGVPAGEPHAAGDGSDPATLVLARVRARRRRHRRLAASGAVLAAVVVVAVSMAAGAGSRPSGRRVDAVGRPGGTSSDAGTTTTVAAGGGVAGAVDGSGGAPPPAGCARGPCDAGSGAAATTTVPRPDPRPTTTTAGPEVSFPEPTTSPSSTSTTAPVAGDVVVVTQADSGRTIGLRVGQVVRVQLGWRIRTRDSPPGAHGMRRRALGRGHAGGRPRPRTGSRNQRSGMKRLAIFVMLAAAVVGTASAASAASAAAADQPPIQPGQLFTGFVNGQRPDATISMACFGPVRPGQTGHPMAGQTLSVSRSLDVPGGNTGSAGTRIKVLIGDTHPVLAAVFTHYGTRPLPTSLTLPCSGTRVVRFVPVPTSDSARPDVLHASFVGQP
ncbi:MAG: hypothetical protein ABR511_00840 [Acidimicrobiales bacterium]